jgi:hypothetical protein
MAKVRGGAQSDWAKGPVGSISFDKSGPIQTVRSRPKPMKDVTKSWEESRARIRYILELWVGLNTNERRAWDDFGANHRKYDFFCGTRKLTGYNLFFGFNSRALRLNLSPILEPPSTPPMNFVKSIFEILPTPPNSVQVSPLLFKEPDGTGYIECWVSRALPLDTTTFDRRRLKLDRIVPDVESFISLTANQNNAAYGVMLRWITKELWPSLQTFMLVHSAFA